MDRAKDTRLRSLFVFGIAVFGTICVHSSVSQVRNNRPAIGSTFNLRQKSTEQQTTVRLKPEYMYVATRADVCGIENGSPLPARDCSDREWEDGVTQLCPWPSDWIRENGFTNFTVENARALLKGKTITISGDSTSRRLMWALCNFLANNATQKGARSGEGCCGTSRVDITCNHPTVLELDIMLRYTPILRYDELQAWVSGPGIRRERSIRRQKGLPNAVNKLNNVAPESMPRSKAATAVHLFLPMTGTWHQDLGCSDISPDQLITDHLDTQGQPCGFNDYVNFSGVVDVLKQGEYVNTTTTSACALASTFCRRFADTVTRVQHAPSYDHAPIFGYGLTNMLTHESSRGYANQNAWMETLARATHTVDEGECAVFGKHTPLKRVSVANGYSCGYLDQTTWMANRSTSGPNLRRLDCMPGEKLQGIHVYNEYGQLMRVQHVLNTIANAEETYAHSVI
eukprot:m.185782 g.185782  ORF g.185782 m.185782 type:complete len:456 (+) comp32242_c0_seq3:418-1785(+)